jgi:hypothetical protein
MPGRSGVVDLQIDQGLIQQLIGDLAEGDRADEGVGMATLETGMEIV